ncbi:CaiB/BaiF CoA transferase family protein [Acrocarpospora pleiomorpha]|uniref:CaiB/BaiF CoA transferase family protein n=1 Tax=Acrocarpospora pleiomorpha TaxID=90975 RepID=UPI0012D2AAE9|nr:CaiB/BaiF CoA-transferase family protein [Acrocarpospora pleiomorpha]
MSTGPLSGVRVIEIGGIGPGPFCGMMLADMGAEVLRVDRPGYRSPANPLPPHADLMNRGRRSVAIDLKSPRGAETVLRLVESADIIFEGFRPGVAERLGIGPEACAERNPRIVFGRMTGWGQQGSLAGRAGHDINYIGLTGVLAAIGTPESPLPPLNVVGDFGGGGMLLAFGLVCALHEARASGRGQVVDASIVDGASLLMTMFHAFAGEGFWSPARGVNLLDGGSHYYNVYECADGRHVAAGAIEPQFYRRLLEGLGLDQDRDFLDGQARPDSWPVLKKRMAEVFRSRTQAEWLAEFEGTDACLTEVVPLGEAAGHPLNVERDAFVRVGSTVQPAPAPRFSRTAPGVPSPPPSPGEHTVAALTSWGLPAAEVDDLIGDGTVVQDGAQW